MVPLYDKLCAQFGWPVDAALRSRLQAENDATLAALDAEIAAAAEREGPVEVGAAMIKKAQFLGATGDVAGALKAYKGLPEKSLSTGGKADVAMASARLCMASSEWECVAPAHRPRARTPLWARPSHPTPPPSPHPPSLPHPLSASPRKRWPRQRR